MKQGAKALIPLGYDNKGEMTFFAVQRAVMEGITNPGMISLPHGNGGYGVENLVAECMERLGLDTTASDWVAVGTPVLNGGSKNAEGSEYEEGTQYYRLKHVLDVFSIDLNAIKFGGAQKISITGLRFFKERNLLSPPVVAALDALPPEAWS